MSTDNQTLGPYRLQEKLGANRRHHVYRALHEPTGQTVALKLINISSRVEPEVARRKIQLEIKILRRLEHPNLVKILDAGIVENKLFVAMELVEGETLAAILSRRGKLAWDQAVDYARQIAEGLNYVHQQELVHLKLNPEKVLVTPDGTVKITDLRVNRARKRRWDEAKKRVLDIAAYMAPEQMTEEGGTAKSDLYAVGVLMFEMITGKLPFEPDTLPRLLKVKRENAPPRISDVTLDCPVWVDNLVAQLLDGSPSNRPHSSYALVASLKETLRMHAEGRSMTEELTRGFTPLTAGRDKSEAFSMLGRQSLETPPAPEETGLNRYNTLLLSLALILVISATAGLLYWTLKPLTEEQLYTRATTALEAEEINESSLLIAKRHLEALLTRFPESEYNEEAEQMLDSVAAQLAERKMKLRLRFGRDPRSDTEAAVVKGWQLAELGDLESARDFYQQALELEDEHEEAERFRKLASRELARIEKELIEKPLTAEAKRAWILDQLANAAQLEANGELVAARKLLQRLESSIGEDEELQDLMQRVRALLEEAPEPEPAADRGAKQEAGDDSQPSANSG